MSDAKYLAGVIIATGIILIFGYLGYQFLMKNNFDYRVSEAVDSVMSVTAQYVRNEKDRERIAQKVKEIRQILEKYRPRRCSH